MKRKRWTNFFLIFCFLLIFSVLIFRLSRVFIHMHEASIHGHEMIENLPEVKEEIYSLDMLMVGDALYHDGVYLDGKVEDGFNYTKQLALIQPIVEKYDLAYYNQESILGGSEIGLSSYPRFNSPYEVGDAFVNAGFNLVSTANNHTLDRGRDAILNSYQYWKSKDSVLMSGSCDSFACMEEIPVGEKNGIRYAFLSYTTTTNGIPIPKGEEYLVNFYSPERVSSDIAKVRDKVDVIFVAMHWGCEYQDYPVTEQTEIAQYLASLGVDIVIGNHPHVIEPIEKIGSTLVFYSFGNFISAQVGVDKLVGLMGSVTITKKVFGDEVTIDISNIQTKLTFTSYNSRFRDFQIIPFDQLDSSVLSNKSSIEEKKMSLVNSYGVETKWGT